VDVLQNDPSQKRFAFEPPENYCQEWIVIWAVCHFRNNACFQKTGRCCVRANEGEAPLLGGRASPAQWK
jgi:hypothetical protein